MLHFLVFLLLILNIGPALARPIIADLSLRKIEIDAGFLGEDILLFGARNDPGDIVVVIRGPEKSYIVRKKERLFGIWVNKEQKTFKNINSFYAISAQKPLSSVNNDYLLEKLNIAKGGSLTNGFANSLTIEDKDNNNPAVPAKERELLTLLSASENFTKFAGTDDEFTGALLNKLENEHLYPSTINSISLLGDTLFRTVINFPVNLPRGIYTAEIYLFSDGILSAVQSTPLIVFKKGFDAFVYDFAYKHSFIYGLIAVGIALSFGYIAGLFFRRT